MMMKNMRGLCSSNSSRGERGFTLVELLVALTLGILIAGAAVAALLAARSGFTSVDSSSQLRENARFASRLMERIVNESGFINLSYFDYPTSTQPPPLRGFDSASVTITGGVPVIGAVGTGVNNGDVLVVSFSGASNSTGAADGSMINCAGNAVPQTTAGSSTSMFHLVTSASGEPTLACTSQNPATGVWVTAPLVGGVESMQILYGTDGVVPGAVPPSLVDPLTSGADSVPERYMRAAQLDVAGNLPATLDNWRRVQSIRVGMVIRGPLNSAPDRTLTAQIFNVLGAGLSASVDAGSISTVPADGRLRQQVIFTIHLRNTQDPVSLLR